MKLMTDYIIRFAALEFASLPMLGWLVAAALPWLIHRWSRQQHRTTPWAAVELLLSAMQQRARRVQMQQWLLLAVRTAILVLVALAVAEPALRQWTLRQWAVGASGRVQRHRIIVLDQSYSMGSQQKGQQQKTSPWQRAQAVARQSIESSEGDALTLLGWSKQAENLLGRPTFDTSVALAALENLSLSQSSANLPTVTRAVLAAIERAEVEMPQIAAHQVVFCTDLSRQTWSVDEGQRQRLEELAQHASITVVNVGDSQRLNVAITNLTIDPAITLQQRETTITATLTCFGKAPATDARVELIVEGHSIDQKQVLLQSGGEATVQFTQRFIDEGAQTVQVVLAGNQDGLVSDDTRWLIVDVRPKLRVACFAGQPGAADDLARALAPGGEPIENESAIEPEVFSIGRLGEMNLSNYPAVLLGSVEELSPREAATLTEYVRQGGGLAIFPGQATTPESLGELQPMLAVQVESIQPTGEYRFDPQEYRHPIVSPFRGQAQSGLLGVAVSQYYRLHFRNEHSSAETVLKFDTGDPALVVDSFGLGRVAISALPASLAARTATGTPWSSFALSPSFLPVIRELVAYLVGDRWLQQRNLLVGEPAIFPWMDGTKTASVRLPAGTRQTLPHPGAEDRGRLVFRETNDQGVYRFSANDQESARFAVNLDGRDSDLTPIDPATLPASFSANTVAGSSPLLTAAVNFSLARTLLAAALMLLLLEIGLAWLLGKGWG